ncbi:MAG: AMP-binding protein, partial [Clostridia bacterium]|nr:AMP-binding protein [Clostridia bacterium]
LPFIKKEDALDDQARRPPFGTQLAVDKSALRRVYCSAGSFYLGFTAADLQAAVATNVAQLQVLGVRPGDIVDIASSYHWVVAGTLFDESVRSLGATVVPGGPGQSDQRLRVLKDVGVTVLQAFTPYAEALGQELVEKGIDPRRDLRVRLLIIGGELRTSDAQRRLSGLWGGAAVRELYGTAETGIVAAECEAGGGMHISEDFVLEIVDPDTGDPVDPAGGGEIVISELYRQAQPFIRYRTGDITEGVDFSQCP